jgi:hypothetical protein
MGDEQASRADGLLAFAGDAQRASDSRSLVADADRHTGRWCGPVLVNEQQGLSGNTRPQYSKPLEIAGLFQPRRQEEVAQDALSQQLEFEHHAGDVAPCVLVCVIGAIPPLPQWVQKHLSLMKKDIL